MLSSSAPYPSIELVHTEGVRHVNTWRNRIAAAVLAAGLVGAWSVHGAGTAAPAGPVAVAGAAPAGADSRIVGTGVESYAAILEKDGPAVDTVNSEGRGPGAERLPLRAGARYPSAA